MPDHCAHPTLPPSPVPAPFVALLLVWIDGRDNVNTTTDGDFRRLLPGR
ncbi:hypothetical protein [Streptomyces malaysiensis]|uniref:Uncharacterized protein n=1 Tax=Streptomyces malaysiensis subsp. samsunensis TaxID=459658 RepID=A0A9X2RWZ5_STRMQ|nr:hypothetical protein [Streptomyces samsunensis]MCQ8833623.1 hypothetical protein [Streptomyces samsunensis]